MTNLTPHTINEISTGTAIPASGIIARIEMIQNEVPTQFAPPGFPAITQFPGSPEFSTPFEPQDGEWYIVSAMALPRMREAFPQSNWASPGPLVRNEQGQPIGCQGFNI